jgi:hypothetical protein
MAGDYISRQAQNENVHKAIGQGISDNVDNPYAKKLASNQHIYSFV